MDGLSSMIEVINASEDASEGAGGGDTQCGYFEGYSTQRFVIITVCSAISTVGALCNLLLLIIFRRTLPSSVFLAGLALLDALLCLTYLLLFGVDAGFVYLQSEFLFILYHRYLVVVFFVCRVVQFAMPYMLMLATLERFMWTTGDRARECMRCLFSDSGRSITAFVVIVTSISMRMVIIFAMEVREFPRCPDFLRTLSADSAEWTHDNDAYYIYDVHVITALQTVVPFFVLLTLNSMIVVKMCSEKKDQGIMSGIERSAKKSREQECLLSNDEMCTQNMVKKASVVASNSTLPEHYVLMEVANGLVKESMISKSNREKAIQLRNAVISMVVIVLSYLICNSLHLFLLYHEKFEPEVLYDTEDNSISSVFYIVLSDSVSISYMLSSAIRLFIYAKCNPKLRREIGDFLRGAKREPVSET